MLVTRINLELYYSCSGLANGQIMLTVKNVGIVIYSSYTCICLSLRSMLNGVALRSSIYGYKVCSI